MAIATHRFSNFCVACLLIAISTHAISQDAIDELIPARYEERSEHVRLDELGDPLPPQARFQYGTERFVSRRPVLDLALSPDDKAILTRDSEYINCWDAVSGRVRWNAQIDSQSSESYGLRAFAFSSNGESFYSQSDPEVLLKWNVATGKSLSIPIKHTLPLLRENRPVNAFPGATLAIDITSDSSRIAAAGGHGVVVYDSAGRSLFEVPNKPSAAIEPADWHKDPLLMNGHYSLAIFSPDGKTLAVVTSDNPQALRLVDGSTGELQCTAKLNSRLVRMAFNSDGSSIGTTERDGAVCQYSTKTGELEWQHLDDNSVAWQAQFKRDEFLSTAITYSPDGKLVAAGAPSGLGQDAVCILDASTGTLQSEFGAHHPWGLAFTADSKMLYSAGWNRIIRRWDVLTSTEVPLEKGFHGTGFVSSTSAANRIAFTDSSGNIHLKSTSPTLKDERLIKTPNTGISAIALSRDGKLVASGNTAVSELTVTVWDTTTSEVVQSWRWPEEVRKASRIGTLEFSPDGSRLAVAAIGRGKAYLFNISDAQQIGELDHELICGLSFDRTGNQLVTAGANEKLCFWDSATGKLLVTSEVIGGDLQNVRCSPVDDLIVTAHFPNVLRIWNSKDMTLRKRAPLSGEANFEALAFSSDGNWLATASSGVVNVINARTAEQIWQAGSHKGRVLTVGFAERDKVLVSGGNDGMVYGWELLPQRVADSPDYDRLWLGIGTGSDLEIKSFKWELIQIGDPAVDEIERRLKPITRVVNLRAIAKGVDRETAESRVRLAMQLCEKNPAVELDVRLKHALDVLAMLRSPKSIALLKQLATGHSSKDVRKEAMFALEAIQ